MRSGDNEDGVTRRDFLKTGAAVAAWVPTLRLGIGDLMPATAAAAPTPRNLPHGLAPFRQAYENWSTEIQVDDVWTVQPRTSADVVALTNWAHANGWRIRPSGKKHGWAPFTVLKKQPADLKVLLLDTTAHLNSVVMQIEAGQSVVTAGPGATLDAVLTAMQRVGRGWTCVPAPGDITLAGAIAISGHGAALPAEGETTPRYAFGSLSNRIVSLDAIMWDPAAKRYVERGFHRSQPITKALLTTLGRIFITRYTLTTEPMEKLRCVSYMNITNGELFAPAGSSGRTFEHFVERAGRIETIGFNGSASPWTKVWSVAPIKPEQSRKVSGPYNYPFSDNIPPEVADLVVAAMKGRPGAAPKMGRTVHAVSTAGVKALDVEDIWGPARYTQHYIKPTTLPASEIGWAVITRRADLQQALHDIVKKVASLNREFAKRDLYPQNMPLELRCSGIDTVDGLGIAGAEPPVLSATTPDLDHPERDTAVWLNVLGLPKTKGSFEYRRAMEQWLLRHFAGTATLRPEWTKGWAFSATNDYADAHVIDHVIPNAFRAGRPADANWDWAIRVFNGLDPHQVFGNPFLDRLLK